MPEHRSGSKEHNSRFPAGLPERDPVSTNDVRTRLEKAWRALDREAQARKDSHGAVIALESFYRGLPDEELSIADQVLIEWAHSDDARKRFDALALIDEFSIVAALPSLRMLAHVFEDSSEASAPYDWAKVNRIIGRLTRGMPTPDSE